MLDLMSLRSWSASAQVRRSSGSSSPQSRVRPPPRWYENGATSRDLRLRIRPRRCLVSNHAGGSGCGGHDHAGRGLRYLSWTWDPDPSDHTIITDYAYILRDSDTETSVRHDRHIEGLFSIAEWRTTLETEGFAVNVVDYDHEDAPIGSVLFVGRLGTDALYVVESTDWI